MKNVYKIKTRPPGAADAKGKADMKKTDRIPSGGAKQSSIRTELFRKIMLLVLVPLLIMGILPSCLSYSNMKDIVSQMMAELAKNSAMQIADELDTVKNVAAVLGLDPQFSDPDMSAAQLSSLIDRTAQSCGLAGGDVLDKSGRSRISGASYADQTFFQQAAQGNVWVSEPVPDQSAGSVTIYVAAPVYQNGGGAVSGVVVLNPQPTFLNDIMADIKINDGASTYMLDKTGHTIADADMQTVLNSECTIEDAKTDSSLKALAALETKMTQGETGFGAYRYGGVSKYLAYAPVEGTDGWSVGVCAVSGDFLDATYISIALIAVLLAVSIAAAVFVSRRLAKGIGGPIALCTQRLEQLAEGDLTSEVPTVDRADEIGRLAAATQTITSSISGMIRDLDRMMNRIAAGDFTVRSQAEALYAGDFAALLASIRNLRGLLSKTLSQIALAADQVSAGADQVSAGAQALSQGATEQASSVEELAATIQDISSHVHDTAHNTAEANESVQQSYTLMNACDEQLQGMETSMDEISRNSQEVGKIIKTIEDIAFQTNILALNAAVEAARAGAAGKGFAVVADEVRNLAGKSAEASKNTAELIEAAVSSVQKGTEAMKGTIEAMERLKETSAVVSQVVGKISDAAAQQSTALEQVTQGVDQISSVVQTNSATSEESAAASEEMSAQAQMLKDLVGGFQFENAGNTAVPAAPAAPAAPVQPDGGADSQPAAHPTADRAPAASGSKY